MVRSRNAVSLESNFDHKLSDCRNEYCELSADEKPLVMSMTPDVLYFDDNIDSGEDVSPDVDNDVNKVPPAEPSRPQRNIEAPDRLGVLRETVGTLLMLRTISYRYNGAYKYIERSPDNGKKLRKVNSIS